LRGGRLAQPLGEPAGYDGVELGERHAEIYGRREEPALVEAASPQGLFSRPVISPIG
jgi:hypothetical protein